MSGFELSGKIAVVTGASSGIGAAIAQTLLDAGAQVIITYHDHGAQAHELVAKAKAKGFQAVAHHLDVADRAAIADLFARVQTDHGGTDILVNNAGIVSYHNFLELDPIEWDRMLAVNLTGAMLCAQQAAAQMKARGGGRIINISSTASLRPEPRRTHYCVSKAGMDMLTKGMALELAPFGITVNSIGPGTILTNMTGDRLDDDEVMTTILAKTPLGRIGTPQDLAGLALLLASEQSSFITGQIIHVDGGRLL